MNNTETVEALVEAAREWVKLSPDTVTQDFLDALADYDRVCLGAPQEASEVAS